MGTIVRALGVTLACLSATPAFAANDMRVGVSVSGGQVGARETVSVHVDYPIRGDALRASNATAFYIYCADTHAGAGPKNGLGAEIFCGVDGRSKLGQSGAEPVDDLVRRGTDFTFKEKLPLPASGPVLWTVVRVDYFEPGMQPGVHRSIYGAVQQRLICRGGRRGACIWGAASTILRKKVL